MLKERLSGANIGILLTLIQAFLRNKSKITVRSLFRYNGVYSLRQLFRFFGKVHPWIEISVSVLKAFLYEEGKRYLIAIDETVIEKSGKHTYGKHRFYSSVYQLWTMHIRLSNIYKSYNNMDCLVLHRPKSKPI